MLQNSRLQNLDPKSCQTLGAGLTLDQLSGGGAALLCRNHPAWQHLEELLPQVGVEPAIENRVADTGAEGDAVADAQDEVIHLDILGGDAPEAEVSDSEEEVEGEEGDGEGDGDAGEDEGHPLVPLPLPLLSPGVYCKPTVSFEESENLRVYNRQNNDGEEVLAAKHQRW